MTPSMHSVARINNLTFLDPNPSPLHVIRFTSASGTANHRACNGHTMKTGGGGNGKALSAAALHGYSEAWGLVKVSPKDSFKTQAVQWLT